MKFVQLGFQDCPGLFDLERPDCPMDIHENVVKTVRGILQEAGFDLERSYGMAKGINFFGYVYFQEEETPLKKESHD